jgi:sulfonate transport system substrate-binding protein
MMQMKSGATSLYGATMSMRTVKQVVLSLVITLSLGLVGLTTSAKETVEFRIGWQKGSNLAVVKAKGEFEKRLNDNGVTVKWIEFPAGPQMLEGLNVGSIDFGVVGETPPVFAQAAGADLLYVGNEPPSPKAEAILVPANSPVKSVAELKGKRVALNKGSNVHFLLVRALENAGLKYSDIQLTFLKPADARAAFEKGAIDAWVIWDPYTSAAVAQVRARVLVDGTGAADNYNFYIATKPYAEQHPGVLKLALEEIRINDQWIETHLKESAAIVGPQVGLPEDVAETALGNYSYGAQVLADTVVAKQQKMADAFSDLGLIPKKVDIASVVWRPTPP